MFTVSRNYEDIVKLLLSRGGVGVNSIQAALRYANQKSNISIALLLQNAKATAGTE